MYFSRDLPTHTSFPEKSFTLCQVPTLLHNDELRLNTQKKYIINLRLHHLIIPSQIIIKASLSPQPWSVHALLDHISISNIESSSSGSYVLISTLAWTIFFVSIFHRSSPIHFILGPRRLWVASWPKPFSDLDSKNASKITCKVLLGVDEYKSLHIKPNCSSFIWNQRYSRQSHKLNISLFNMRSLTYHDEDITYGAITQGSQFPLTSKNPKSTTVIFPCHHTISLIGVYVPIWTCFPPTLSSKHPLTVRDA